MPNPTNDILTEIENQKSKIENFYMKVARHSNMSIEFINVYERFKSLTSFIGTDAFNLLAKNEQENIHGQVDSMHMYIVILAVRIQSALREIASSSEFEIEELTESL